MSETTPPQPPGWYYAQGDPPGTQRYWDGSQWQGGPQPAPGSASAAGMAADPGQGGLASPGQRILARIIDWVIVFVVSLIIGVIFGGNRGMGAGADGASLVAGILSTLVFVAYEIWFTANKGGTPGKLVLNIRVADQATRATPIDYQQAFLRASPLLIGFIPVNVISIVLLLVGLASLVMLFVDSQRQAVWDKIAKTVVVKA